MRRGQGPTKGKTGVVFTAIAPDGSLLTRRFFTNIPEMAEGVAALLPPSNDYGWNFWTAAPSQATMPSYVKVCRDAVVFVPCQRREPTEKPGQSNGDVSSTDESEE